MNAPSASAVQAGMKRSREEIDNLKLSWRSDPIWDIEDTEGFEAHREELLVFRLGIERAAAERQAREHEILVRKILERALRVLPGASSDSIGRPIAESEGSTVNILLRCMAEMVAPVEVASGASDDEHNRRIEALESKVHKLERELAALHLDTIG